MGNYINIDLNEKRLKLKQYYEEISNDVLKTDFIPTLEEL